MSLELVPITLKEANAFVVKYHRHHKAKKGHKFSIAAYDGDVIVGVVIVGRPVARMIDCYNNLEDKAWTLEVNRLCSDGTKNTCSFLYAAAWRVARNLGWKRLITYILNDELGTTLYATGWKCLGAAGGGKWGNVKRPRIDTHPTQGKILFEITV